MSDWIEWNGGDCPVRKNTRVDVRYRDGQVVMHIKANILVNGLERDVSPAFWFHHDQDNDIVSYRISKEQL
jgi:hypothetical protein